MAVSSAIGVSALSPQEMLALMNIPVVVPITAMDFIASAPTNAPTNLNVITTLLGVLVGEVNSINTRYNDLATKFNTELAGLKVQGIVATS